MNLLTIFITFFMGVAVQASPAADNPVLTETEFGSSIESVLGSAIIPQVTLDFDNKTSTNNSVAQIQEFDKHSDTKPLMVFCSKYSCKGECQPFRLVGDHLNECYSPKPNPFKSFFIYNPSLYKLHFRVGLAALDGCQGLVMIPKTNTCYDIRPSGRSWVLLKGITY